MRLEHPRKLIQMSLRTLLLGVLLCALLTNHYVSLARRRSHALAYFATRQSCEIKFSSHAAGWSFASPFGSVPRWLIRLVDKRFPSDVQRIRIYRGVTDTDLSKLADLPGVQVVELLGVTATPAGLSHLQRLDSLEVLEYWPEYRTSLGDEGVDYFMRLDKLRRLGLPSAQITDDGLRKIARLKPLQERMALPYGAKGLVAAAVVGHNFRLRGPVAHRARRFQRIPHAVRRTN